MGAHPMVHGTAQASGINSREEGTENRADLLWILPGCAAHVLLDREAQVSPSCKGVCEREYFPPSGSVFQWTLDIDEHRHDEQRKNEQWVAYSFQSLLHSPSSTGEEGKNGQRDI